MTDILGRVSRFIIHNNLISENDIVGCALSGGADSVFMTFVLNELSRQMNFKVVGIHVNHMLRGDESYRDENFSREFCEKFKIEFKIYREDVEKYSRNKKISVEMAGREVRYKIFENLRNDNIITKCALGHHADDDVETIVMRIFKGTGLKGLEGISEIRDNFYIRPILFLRKVLEIEKFLKSNNIKFIFDTSNSSDSYLRNKLRMDIIPAINKSFSMDVTNNILTLKEICRYDNDFFDNLVEDNILKHTRIFEEKIMVDKCCFKLHEALLYRIIRYVLKALNSELNNVGLKHIKYICGIVHKDIDKMLQIRNDIFCVNKKNYVVFLRKFDKTSKIQECYYELLGEDEIVNMKNRKINNLEREVFFLNKKIKLIFTLERNFSNLDFRNNEFKYFSLDNVKSSISIRNRRYGDLFKPFGMRGTKKLKDFLVNENVKNKNQIPLICFDDDIVWVVGIRNSENHKVLSNSNSILKLELYYL